MMNLVQVKEILVKEDCIFKAFNGELDKQSQRIHDVVFKCSKEEMEEVIANTEDSLEYEVLTLSYISMYW